MNRYFLIFLLLLLIEIAIALFSDHFFIRGFLGDVLVIPLLYSLIKIFIEISTAKAIISIVIFAFIIEFLQSFQIYESLGMHSELTKILLGTTFDWKDLAAYLFGGILIYGFEEYFGRLLVRSK